MYFNNIGRLLGTIDSQTRHDDDLGITRTRDAVTGLDHTFNTRSDDYFLIKWRHAGQGSGVGDYGTIYCEPRRKGGFGFLIIGFRGAHQLFER